MLVPRRSRRSPRTLLVTVALAVAAGLAGPALRGRFAGPRLPASAARPQVREGAWVEVRRIVDGDTVVLANGERVRYIGVDTPELHHPRKPVQYYAREAAEFNRRLVERQPVRLEFDVERRDRYGRTLAYLFLQDGTFVNAELVRQGYAQLLTIPPNVKYVDLFTKLQKEAREAGRGLWSKQ